MEPVLDSCAGMDVHEKKVDVCIAHGPLEKYNGGFRKTNQSKCLYTINIIIFDV